jgi:hypothetical protein
LSIQASEFPSASFSDLYRRVVARLRLRRACSALTFVVVGAEHGKKS